MKNNIASERTKLGLSQTQLGDCLHVSRDRVSDWESGKTIPKADSLVKMADMFGCTVDYLLARTEQRGFINVTVSS